MKKSFVPVRPISFRVLKLSTHIKHLQQTHLEVWPLQLFNQSNKLLRFGETLILKSSLFPLQCALPTGSHGCRSLPRSRFSGCTAGLLLTCVSASLSAALAVTVFYSMIESVYPRGVFCGSKPFSIECVGHHTHNTHTHRLGSDTHPVWPVRIDTYTLKYTGKTEVVVSVGDTWGDQMSVCSTSIHLWFSPALSFSFPFISLLALHEATLICSPPPRLPA